MTALVNFWQRAGTGRRGLILFVAGLAGAFAQAPFYMLPLMLLPFALLNLALHDAITNGARARTGLYLAFMASSGLHVAGLYWITISLTTDLAQFWWLIPFSLLGVPALLSFFVAPAGWLFVRLKPHWSAGLFLFPALWMAGEWARSTLFSGFPWNLPGQIWTVSAITMQPAAWGGIWLLSILTVFIAFGSGYLLNRQTRRVSSLLLAIALLLPFGAGGIRFVQHSEAAADLNPLVNLRIVQPNQPRRLGWTREQKTEAVDRLIRLSQTPSERPVTHLIWPEAAVPYSLNRLPDYTADLARVAMPGATLITGADRLVENTAQRHGFDYWNSLYFIGPDGAIQGTYDKFHLVPFGEYMPLQEYIPFKRLTAGIIDISTGTGPQSVKLPGLPAFSPLICYETIFTGAVMPDGPKPDWLLSVTNDAWFGLSSGPYQHLAIARLRAVEEGRPMVRASNPGVSAVIDSLGRVQHSLGLNRQGVLDAQLPAHFFETTLYQRIQYLSVWPWIGLLSLVSFALLWRNRNSFSRQRHTKV